MPEDGSYAIINEEHGAKASKLLQNLYNSKLYSDVTLATEDDKQIKCHQSILTTFSSFFERILTKNPHPNPLIYLKGIKSGELEMLLQFAYLGECIVPENALGPVLDAAKELAIYGFGDCDVDGEESEETEDTANSNMNNDTERAKKQPKVSEDNSILVETDPGDKPVIKNEKPDKSVMKLQEESITSDKTTKAINALQLVNESLNESMTGSGPFNCGKCDYSTARKRIMKEHVMGMHSDIIVKIIEQHLNIFL